MNKLIAQKILAAFVIAASFFSAGRVLADNGTWGSPSGGSWTNSANWSGGIIATGSGNTADFSQLTLASAPTVTLDGAQTIGNLIFGDVGNVYSWSLNIGSAGPLTLAVGSGSPTINVSNQTTTISAALAGTQGLAKAGSGALTLTGANTYSGTTTVGTSADAGILTYSGSGSYAPATASLLNIGGATGRGVFNMNSSGTVNFTSSFPSIGGNGGAADTGMGALNQTAGTLNLVQSGQYMTIGNNGSGAAYGSVNLSGGTLTVTSGAGIRLGYEGLGSYVQSGGTLNCGRYFVIGGGSSSGNGVATFTGGSATVNSGYRIHLSDNAACKGTLNIGTEAGGTASVATLSTAGLYIVAVSGGNTALNLNSGTLTLGGPITEQAAGTTALNLNGGTLQAGAGTVTLVNNANGLVGHLYNGGVTVDSQANISTIAVHLLATTGNGIYPSGGSFAISGGGSGYIGAPLVAVTTSGSGTGALAIATVSGGVVTGVTMTCPGQNYAAGDTLTFTFAGGGYTSAASPFNYVLAADDLSPNALGGLTKLGTGTLNLTTNSTYMGNTLVNAGTLNVTADGGLGSGNVKVVDSAFLTLSGGATNGYIAASANLVLGAGAVANLNFTGTNTVGGLSVDGGLTYLAVGTYGSSGSSAGNHDDTHFTGAGVINVTAQPTGATVALVSSLNPSGYSQSVTFTATANGSSGTPSGTVSFKDGAVILSTIALNSGVAALTTSALVIGTHNITAVYNGNGTYSSATSPLLAQVVNPRSDIWSASVNNAWDINTTSNWLDLAAQAVYHNGDVALFNDNAIGGTDVSLGVPVAPYSVVVTNNSKDYSLSGAGAITGSAGVSKFGGGTLTINNANSYSGDTTIQGGTLNYNGASASSGNGVLNVSNGVVNVDSSGTLTFSGFTSLGGIAGDGSDAGNGVINQTGGTINLGSGSTYLELGAGDTNGLPGSYGSYVLSGGSLSTINSSGVRVGASGMGVFLQTGGTFYCDRWFAIGSSTGSTGPGGGQGEATFTGGTASLNPGNRIIVGDKPNATAVFNLGTLAGGNAAITALYNSGGKGGLELIDSAGAYTGTANLNSGTLTLAGSIYRNSTLGEVVNLNFNGGVIVANNDMNLIDSSIYYAYVFNGGLVVDTQGHTVTNAVNMQPTYGNGIYPAGGSIAVTSGGGSGYIGMPLVTISGGSGSGAMAIANISSGVVTGITMTCPGQSYQAGDTVNFDFAGGGAATPAGTFSYTLQAGDVTANNGGLTKLGSGTLALTGNNAYTGPTVVEGGTLLLNTSYGSSTGDYIVTNNGTLDVGFAYSGSQLSVNNFTFAGPVSGALTLDLSAAGSIAAAPIYANGSLDVTGVATINVLVGGLAVGQYPLIQYASLTGSGSFALGSLPVGVQAYLVTNTVSTPNSIDLVVASAGQPRWNGLVNGVSNGTWDINTTANWVDALTSQVEAYREGQPVLFDDNAGGTTTVNLVADVHPGNVVFNNNSLAYTLTGTNKISGATGLTILGNGSVTIQNANDYTGATTVGGGTLNVANLANGGSPSAIGAASADPDNLVLTNGGNLVYSGPAAAVDRGYTVGTGGGTITLNSSVSLGGQVVTANSGTFTKAGPSTLTYTGTGVNQLGAANNIKAGIVVLDGSAGSQSNSVSGLMLVGSDSSSTGSLVVSNSILGAGTLTVDYGLASLRLGAVVDGNGTLNIGQSSGANSSMTVVDNAVLNNIGVVILGGVSGRGTLNLDSSGTSTLATGGTGQRFCVGGTDTTGDSGAGAVNMTAGILNTAPSVTDYIELGAGDNNAYGAFNLSGGSVIEPGGYGVRVGASGLGVYNQTGGTLACGRYFAIGTVGGFLTAGGNGMATFSGGTATITSSYRIIVGDKPGSSGVLNIGTEAGGTASVSALSGTGVTMIGDNAALSAVLNLNQGTLQLGGPVYKGNAPGGPSALNLNGGTLQAGANNITLANNSLDSANVYNGGLKVDSQANNTTVSANLLATTGNGVYPAGGLINVTSGGGNGYIGAPLVDITTSGTGSNVTANATILGGVVTGVIITSPGQGYVAGDHLLLAFSGGGATNPASVFDYTLQAGDLAANGTGGLTKIGSGMLTLSGDNTYVGNTVVSDGILSLTGGLLGGVSVTNASMLTGNGIIAGAVNVSSNATLAAGTSSIGVLTISNNLTFAAGATNFARLNESTGTNDSVQGLTQVNYAGTLVVSNLAGTLAANDKFTLFSAGSYAGNFSTLVLPPLAAGLTWSNSLAIDGSIQVVAGSSVIPPVLTNSVSGGVLTLAWPADHLGWKLQAQTNALNIGLTTNWVTVPGSDVLTSTNIVINPLNPAVFYRLISP